MVVVTAAWHMLASPYHAGNEALRFRLMTMCCSHPFVSIVTDGAALSYSVCKTIRFMKSAADLIPHELSVFSFLLLCLALCQTCVQLVNNIH